MIFSYISRYLININILRIFLQMAPHTCRGIFISQIGPPNMANMIFRRNSYTVKVSAAEWQRQNEANVHRIAEKFADGRNCVSPLL